MIHWLDLNQGGSTIPEVSYYISQSKVAMESTNWLPLIDHKRCTNCGHCVNVCPTHALDRVENKIKVFHPKACNYCGQCELVCPVSTIVLPYQIELKGSS